MWRGGLICQSDQRLRLHVAWSNDSLLPSREAASVHQASVLSSLLCSARFRRFRDPACWRYYGLSDGTTRPDPNCIERIQRWHWNPTVFHRRFSSDRGLVPYTNAEGRKVENHANDGHSCGKRMEKDAYRTLCQPALHHSKSIPRYAIFKEVLNMTHCVASRLESSIALPSSLLELEFTIRLPITKHSYTSSMPPP